MDRLYHDRQGAGAAGCALIAGPASFYSIRFLLGVPVSSVIGGPISGALLGLDRFGGLSGWQWMFVIERLPSAVLGVVILRRLAGRPAQRPG